MLISQAATEAHELDASLSNRFIALDDAGYFLIYLDRDSLEICADQYSNTINSQGLACDPDTGKPLSCNQDLKRRPIKRFRAKTAKQLCINMFEQDTPAVTQPDHAAYLGREFTRAEMALYSEGEYVQD